MLERRKLAGRMVSSERSPSRALIDIQENGFDFLR
jgi:hypothetical protein